MLQLAAAIMDEEVIISPQIDQIDIGSFTKDPDFVEDEDNGNEVKGELLDSIASEGETATAASLEPNEGMEFESEEAARAFYSAYARHVGFRVRISRYTRSRRDNSIISRLIVCSKEGFREPRGGGCSGGERKQQRQRAVTRVGCKAMLMVKKMADGKWVVSRFVKEHNHGPVPPRKLELGVVRKEEEVEEDSAAAVEPSVALTDGGEVWEPFEGMEFDSEEDARGFYIDYARQMGFRARISKYCRSRRDNSIISRQIVCSKEGFREMRIKKEDADDGRVKRPRVVTRIGCKAMIVVKKVNAGKWVVSRFDKEHNHALGTSKKEPLLLQSSNDDAAAEKGLVAHVGGDDVLCNVAVVMSGERCDGTLGTSRESLTVLYNRLCCEAIKFAQEGAVSEEIYNVAMSALNEAIEKVTAAKSSAAAVAQGVNGGHGSCITKCSNEAKKAVSGNNLVVMQQPVKFVLIPSTSLGNDSKPANHSVESPMVPNIPSGQGIGIPNPTSVLKQSSPTAQSVKGLVGNGATEHMGAVQNSQKLDNIGASQLKTTGGNGSSLASAGASEAQKVAFPALPVTVYMPVMGNLCESSSGPGSNAYTLVTAPVEASPVTTGARSQVDVQQSTAPANDRKDQSPWSYTGPNPQVHATAIAAGARIIPPQEAASLIKAIEARVRNSKPAFGSGCMQLSASVAQNPLSCNNTEAGPKPQGPAHAHAEAIGGQEQASSEEMRLHEPGEEGFKEMDVAMMDHSAVYDSACDDHLFSDAGS